MEADKTVKVDCLIWDDAWDLFKKKKVGDQPFLVYHDFPKLTRIIATQYGGLPLYFFFYYANKVFDKPKMDEI